MSGKEKARDRTPTTLIERIYLYEGEELKEQTLPQAVKDTLLGEIERCETLTPKEKMALKLRFEGLTLRETGEIMEGVTREAARQSEKRGIRKLGSLSEDEIEGVRDILWNHNLVSSPLSVPSRGRPPKRRHHDL